MELEEIKKSYFIELQRFIYNKLGSSVHLNKLRVYRKIPKDSRFPFIFLGKIMVFDRSLKDIMRVHFLHEVAVFSREDSIEDILSWGEVIKRELVGNNISCNDFCITEISFLQMELDVMSDGLTNKMLMKFKFSSERVANVA